MSLLGIYIIGVVATMIPIVFVNYYDYNHGCDILMKHVYLSVLTTIASWVGFVILVGGILASVSDKVIIKGKEDAE